MFARLGSRVHAEISCEARPVRVDFFGIDKTPRSDSATSRDVFS